MPAAKPATGKSRRAEQCVYTEDSGDGRRRCRRSGLGNPPLCNPHKIAFAETIKASEGRKFGGGIADLFDRVINGKKVNRKVIENAFDDVAQWAAAGAAQQTGQGRAGPFRPAPGFPFPPNWRPTPPRPPVDPRIAEQKRAKQRARIVLGFTPTEALSPEVIKERRKEMARAHHPDKAGGSTQKMQEVNAAADCLLEPDLV